MTDQDLKTMSVADLLARLERNIRYGCHSTRAEAGRSFAGKELRNRGKEAAKTIADRLLALNAQESQDPIDARVRDGLVLVLCWMVPDDGQIDSGYAYARSCAGRAETEFLRRRNAGEEGY